MTRALHTAGHTTLVMCDGAIGWDHGQIGARAVAPLWAAEVHAGEDLLRALVDASETVTRAVGPPGPSGTWPTAGLSALAIRIAGDHIDGLSVGDLQAVWTRRGTVVERSDRQLMNGQILLSGVTLAPPRPARIMRPLAWQWTGLQPGDRVDLLSSASADRMRGVGPDGWLSVLDEQVSDRRHVRVGTVVQQG